LAAVCHVVMVGLLVALPLVGEAVAVDLGLGWIYAIAVAGIAALLLYEHRLVRPDDLTRVNVAFFHVNAVISIGLFLLASIDLLWL